VTPTLQAAETYRRTAVQSASPMQLVVMLYDGALRFLVEARDADMAGNLTARAQAVSKALAIVAECQSTLNLERGGTIAHNLDRLYSYMLDRLLDVAMKKDASGIDEVHKLLSTLRDAWSQAAVQESQPVAVAR
jgi:flagellar secretion chaperone FliS